MKLFVFINVLFFFGCTQNESVLDPYFSVLITEMNIDDLAYIERLNDRNLMELSLLDSCSIIEISNKPDVVNYFTKLGIKSDASVFPSFIDELKFVYLTFAFHEYVKLGFVDSAITFNKTHEYYNRLNIEIKKEHERYEKENAQLVLKSDSICSIGSYVTFVLPIRDGTTFYQTYPNSLDYSSEDDSLLICGEIIDKVYDKFKDYPNLLSSDNVFWKIVLKELSNPNYKIDSKKYINGDTIEIYLKAYGRSIMPNRNCL